MYRINPNKTLAGEIYDYSLFEGMLSYITTEMGLSEYYFNRVDFRLDSFAGHYDDLLKINRLLFLLVDHKRRRHNRYESKDFLTLDNLTLRIQGKRFEAEYYNKRNQNPAGHVEYRLELRSKSLLAGSSIPALIDEWCRRLAKATELYQPLLAKQNKHLLCQYKKEIDLYKTPWEFARRYESNIFSRRQLSDLFESFGVNNPSKSADNFFDRNRHVERISQADVISYVQLVTAALHDYLLR